MKYRIKVIEKNNGHTEYYPQYFDDEGRFFWVKCLLYPIFIVLKSLADRESQFKTFQYFWEYIDHDGYCTLDERNPKWNNYACSDENAARASMAKHNARKQAEVQTRQAQQQRDWEQKPKRITHINVQ